MEIIRDPSPSLRVTGDVVALRVDRHTLAKRRWRGVAEDGREFGFDLEKPLTDGALFFFESEKSYIIAQSLERVLELRKSERGMRSDEAAQIGWTIGNLHFQIEIADGVIRVADDPALRQLFEREGWKYEACERIFHPLRGGHHH